MSGIYGDKLRAESTLPGSELNWTTVYPVILNDAPASAHVTAQSLANRRPCPGYQRCHAPTLLTFCSTSPRT